MFDVAEILLYLYHIRDERGLMRYCRILVASITSGVAQQVTKRCF